MKRRSVFAVATLAVVLALVACGGKGESEISVEGEAWSTSTDSPVTVASVPAPPASSLISTAGGSYTANDVGQVMLDLINEERCARGLAPLVLDDRLNAAAEKQSVDMAFNDFFDHISPTTGKGPGDRVSDEGYSWGTVGENIQGGMRTPEDAFQAWMNSDGHRANMLYPDFREMGIADVECADCLWTAYDGNQYHLVHWWTMVLATTWDDLGGPALGTCPG